MDRRKKINVNKYEALTDAELRRVVEPWHARVCPKVRVADALDINKSGLDDEQFNYALKAHFDFVVEDEGGFAAFAVEYDGPHHSSDRDARRRDLLKNSISKALGMPLIRIGSQHLEPVQFSSPYSDRHAPTAGKFTSVLAWVAKCWFLEREFDQAQAQGKIRPDIPFMPSNVFGNDPTIHAKAYVSLLQDDGVVTMPWPDVERFCQDDYWSALVTAHLDSGGAISGYSSCMSINFSALSAYELCVELAILDVASKLEKYRGGRLVPYTLEEIQQWKQRLRNSTAA
jgi:hypothetical protein